MDRPIITLLDEIARATEHCKRESRFLEDEDLLILFGAHLKMKYGEYQAAMRRQETNGHGEQSGNHCLPQASHYTLNMSKREVR